MKKRYSNEKTIYGSVTIDFIKETPVWKSYADENNKVAHEDFPNVLKACLYYLGWDNEKSGYQRLDGLTTVRDKTDKTKGLKTIVYSFPVRKDFIARKMYENNTDIIKGNAPNADKFDLSSYGNSFWTNTKNKKTNNTIYNK
jgi:hypothetical protein